MRNRSEFSQVAREGFGPERIAVTRGYTVATVDQHGRMALAAPKKFGVSHKKDAERRDKMSVRAGKDTGSRQDP
jgi:hypothetical protein